VLANARRIIGCLRNADPARGVLGSAHATLLPRHAGAWPTRQQSPTAAAAAAAAAAGGGDAAIHVRLGTCREFKITPAEKHR